MDGDVTFLDRMGAMPVPAPETPARPADDHYRSPPECVRALASVVDLSAGMHEFCAGDGTMATAAADVLGVAAVHATTLYPADKAYFPVKAGIDFLEPRRLTMRNLVSNVPYSFLHGRRLAKAGAATRMIAHGLDLLEAAGDDAGSLCVLLDLRFRLSEERNEPGGLLYERPPAVIHAFADRVTMYPSGTTGEVNPGNQSFAWFVWRWPFRQPGGDTSLRVDLNSRRFRRPDDVSRFGLPIIGSKKVLEA